MARSLILGVIGASGSSLEVFPDGMSICTSARAQVGKLSSFADRKVLSSFFRHDLVEGGRKRNARVACSM